jgi:hypothetical protein
VWYSIPLRSGVGARLKTNKMKQQEKNELIALGTKCEKSEMENMIEEFAQPIESATEKYNRIVQEMKEAEFQIKQAQNGFPIPKSKKPNSFTKSLKNQLAAKNRKQ